MNFYSVVLLLPSGRRYALTHSGLLKGSCLLKTQIYTCCIFEIVVTERGEGPRGGGEEGGEEEGKRGGETNKLLVAPPFLRPSCSPAPAGQRHVALAPPPYSRAQSGACSEQQEK